MSIFNPCEQCTSTDQCKRCDFTITNNLLAIQRERVEDDMVAFTELKEIINNSQHLLLKVYATAMGESSPKEGSHLLNDIDEHLTYVRDNYGDFMISRSLLYTKTKQEVK